MKFQHKSLSNGRWDKLCYLEQMANIGSEVERAISWREKGNEEYSKLAFFRSLELFNLTLSSPDLTFSQLRETARANETWIDFFAFNNVYKSSSESWRKYFFQLLFLYKNLRSLKAD